LALQIIAEAERYEASRAAKPAINKRSRQLALQQQQRKNNNNNNNSSSNNNSTNAQRVEDRLTAQGHQYEQRRQHQQQRERERQRQRQNATKTAPNSDKIASRLEARTHMSTRARLHMPIGAVKASTLAAIDQPTFQPQLNEKSMRMAKHNNDNNNDNDNNNNNNNYDDAGDYRTPNRSRTASTGSSYSSSSNAGVRMFERQQQWQHRKEERLARERADKERQEMDGVTFKPRTTSSSR